MSTFRKLLLISLLGCFPLFAQSAHSNIKDPELAKKFKHISEEIMCVCGCNEPLQYCNHAQCIAWGIRGVVDNLLLAGKDEQYIINGYINGYGDIVDTDPAFAIIRTEYSRYQEQFRTGFTERFRSYPSKRSPQSMILVILLIGAGIAGIFLKRKFKKLGVENKPSVKTPASDAEKDKLYKSLYD